MNFSNSTKNIKLKLFHFIDKNYEWQIDVFGDDRKQFFYLNPDQSINSKYSIFENATRIEIDQKINARNLLNQIKFNLKLFKKNNNEIEPIVELRLNIHAFFVNKQKIIKFSSSELDISEDYQKNFEEIFHENFSIKLNFS
jgi:hypothetical protein